MKNFYSCIDASLPAPQPLQHLAIREIAQKVGGKIVFYGAEEVRTLKTQSFIRTKLKRFVNVQGICFFTFHQFRYGNSVNWDLLMEILKLGFEIHFAREGLSLESAEDLRNKYVFLLAIDYTLRETESRKWVNGVLEKNERK